MISIREQNKDWANNLILENIFAARYLELAREAFASIRTIADENDTDFIVTETLTKQIRWASSVDKKSIKGLLKNISERSVRNMLYQKIVLYQNERPFNREELKAAMENVAKDLLSKGTDWTDCIDVLLKGGRQYDANAFWFGFALGQLHKDSDKLIDRCLNLYNTIPQDDQSCDFVAGLFYKFVDGEDYSVFKQKRDEMLQNKHLVYLGLAMSNKCDNTIADLSKIKDALIGFSLPIDNINKVYSVQLTENEYCDFSLDLIKHSKEASDAGIKLLDRAKDINLTECLCTAITLYNYWDVIDYKYGSAYSNLIEMLTNTLKSFPDKEFAKTIISSIIKNCNSRNFNPNYSVVDLFKILVEQYQDLLLDNIEKLFNDESLLERYWLSENYQKVDKLKELFSLCSGNGMKYFEIGRASCRERV